MTCLTDSPTHLLTTCMVADTASGTHRQRVQIQSVIFEYQTQNLIFFLSLLLSYTFLPLKHHYPHLVSIRLIKWLCNLHASHHVSHMLPGWWFGDVWCVFHSCCHTTRSLKSTVSRREEEEESWITGELQLQCPEMYPISPLYSTRPKMDGSESTNRTPRAMFRRCLHIKYILIYFLSTHKLLLRHEYYCRSL